jgi:hypothetical protein
VAKPIPSRAHNFVTWQATADFPAGMRAIYAASNAHEKATALPNSRHVLRNTRNSTTRARQKHDFFGLTRRLC